MTQLDDKRNPVLLPCPFCGGAAAFRWCGGVMLAECTSCGTSKGDGNAEDYYAGAAMRWNTRAAASSAIEPRVPREEIAHMLKRLREYNPVEGQEGLRMRGILMREAATMIEDLAATSHELPMYHVDARSLTGATIAPSSIKPAVPFGLELKDHLWRMYREGQISADHTAREVFDQMLDSLSQWLEQQPAAPSSAIEPPGNVLVDVQLIRDIQSNAATGEPEWSSIEDRLLKLALTDGETP